MVCIKKEEVKNKYKERGYEIELSNQLEEIIKTPVDVIVLNRTSDFVLHRVSKGILIKNSNDDLRINFITAHWKSYLDFRSKIQEHVEEMKAISKELSERLINMAKFRNLLVHLYWKVDDERIYDVLQSELDDFDDFIGQIARRYL
jgi:hypothetical protein